MLVPPDLVCVPLQARIGVLRRLCGLAPLAACVKPDISVTNMEFLQLELERLAVEKVWLQHSGRLGGGGRGRLWNVCAHSSQQCVLMASNMEPDMQNTHIGLQKQCNSFDPPPMTTLLSGGVEISCCGCVFAAKLAYLLMALCLSLHAHAQERREDLLRSLVDGLAGVCSDIGEDAKAAAAEVHPNLPLMW